MMADPNATEAQVLRAFDEAEGQGGRVVRGDELTEWFQAINEQLEAEGHPTDIDAMTDDELTAHFQRVSEISDRLREDGMTTPFD